MRSIIALTVAFAVIGMAATLAQDEAPPDRIIIERPNLFPEGVEYDTVAGHFLVSSHTEGTIFVVGDDGSLTPFIEDEDLGLTNGIHIDAERGRLLVANNNVPTSACAALRELDEKPAVSLGIYDLATGDRIDMVDLTDLLPDVTSFANDIAVGEDGVAYVTDWCGGAIYSVDLEGEAEMIFHDAAYINDIGSFNGVEYHPDGYLLLSGGFVSSLFKAPLDNLEDIAPVDIDLMIFADGLTLRPDGQLIVAGAIFTDEGFEMATLQFGSDADWSSAETTGVMVYDRFGTTAALRDGEVYTILSDVIAEQDVETFEIIRVVFDSTG